MLNSKLDPHEPQLTHRLLSCNQLPILRRWYSEPKLSADHLVYPLFISNHPNDKIPISSLPGQYRWGIESLLPFLETLIIKGLKAVLLFGMPSESTPKDEQGTCAFNPENGIFHAIQRISAMFPHLLVAVDVCLCAYTSHGHCHVVHPQQHIDVEQTSLLLAKLALRYIKAGAHMIAPSDMTDTRIFTIKRTLLHEGYGHVPVMSYSAKFASSFYGPFRESSKTSLHIHDSRQRYQLPVSSRKLALRALTRDANEGADILMIKPGSMNLDIVKEASESFPQLPIAMYQVSGEYAMLIHASRAGAFDLKDAVLESLNAGIRAGARILITYFTPQVLDWLLELNHVLHPNLSVHSSNPCGYIKDTHEH